MYNLHVYQGILAEKFLYFQDFLFEVFLGGQNRTVTSLLSKIDCYLQQQDCYLQQQDCYLLKQDCYLQQQDCYLPSPITKSRNMCNFPPGSRGNWNYFQVKSFLHNILKNHCWLTNSLELTTTFNIVIIYYSGNISKRNEILCTFSLAAYCSSWIGSTLFLSYRLDM